MIKSIFFVYCSYVIKGSRSGGSNLLRIHYVLVTKKSVTQLFFNRIEAFRALSYKNTIRGRVVLDRGIMCKKMSINNDRS